MKKLDILNLSSDQYSVAEISQGYGTRPSQVVLPKYGRRYQLAKTWKWNIGELRSEVCASAIGEVVGMPVQDARLCIVAEDMRKKLDGVTRPEAVLCVMDVRRESEGDSEPIEEILHGRELLAHVTEVSEEMQRRQFRELYTLENVVTAIERYEQDHPEAGGRLKQEFFDLAVFDALIGNTERHETNWGVLISAKDKSYIRMVKAFDHGISLLWDFERNPRRSQLQLWTQEYARRAPSRIKRKERSRMTLYELCTELHRRGFCSSESLEGWIARVQDIEEGNKLHHAVIDMQPRDGRFGMTDQALMWVCQYVILRKGALLSTLRVCAKN